MNNNELFETNWRKRERRKSPRLPVRQKLKSWVLELDGLYKRLLLPEHIDGYCLNRNLEGSGMLLNWPADWKCKMCQYAEQKKDISACLKSGCIYSGLDAFMRRETAIRLDFKSGNEQKHARVVWTEEIGRNFKMGVSIIHQETPFCGIYVAQGDIVNQ